ncbi:MAG TPA: LysM peptidoglycan-binding domain-containing protein [Acidimicrobiales bacterium]|nr:LysM peptidoglycan-binding domain-containing protein [Acidimicrobiales bacterium]
MGARLGMAAAPVAAGVWLAASGAPAMAATTTVQPGDTLTAIAARWHTTVAALVAANHIADPNEVAAGTALQVPSAPSPVATTAAGTPGPATGSVVVRRGDTLSAIAARWHTTVAALVAANHIADPNEVAAGTRLTLPAPPLPPGWGPGGPLPAGLLSHPDRMALRPAFVQAASQSGIAPSLLEALCWWESGWQPSATSSTGALGLCQIEPSTVAYARTTLLHNAALNPRSGADNIAMAAAYLHDLTVRDGGNLRTAVAAYYQGLSSIRQSGFQPGTKVYVTGIFNYAALFAAAG